MSSRITQVQDAVTVNALNPQIPYLALDAWVACLTQRLSVIYPPPKPPAVSYDAMATKALNTFLTQYTENVPLFLSPVTAGYWR